MNSFFHKLIWLSRRRNKETELREELQFHLDEEAEQRQAEGLGYGEAGRAARRELGNPALVREDTRATWGWMVAEQLGQDVRYAVRVMASSRWFTILAVTTLALGIGANTAIYSFMDAILLRSLPVADPASLVVLKWHAKNTRVLVMQSMSGHTDDDPVGGTTAGIMPFSAFELFQKNDAVFSSVFAYCPARSLNVTAQGQAEIGDGEYVSGDYFRGLAVPPAAGRLIIPDDDRVGAPAVAVVSHGFSRRRFGDAAKTVGQSILINNIPFTVIGVTPSEFFGADPGAAPELYLPMHATLVLGAAEQFGFRAKDFLDRNFYWLDVMGRLRPGVSLVQAQAALAPPFQQWVASTASNDRERANLPALVVTEGAGGLDTLRSRYSKPLYLLFTLVALILALACANVANLLLARAAVRRREIALRLSVGASRFRIVRQLLTESVLLASLGGVTGVFFAVWGIRVLTLLLANGDANFTLHADLNWRVLGIAAGLSILTGTLFGLAPALQSTRVDVMPALKETRAGQRGGHSFWPISLSHLLMAGQIAISLLMLVAAGLFVRTLSNLHSIDLGFKQENVLLFKIDARKAGHKDPEISAFYGDLRQRFGAIPGVRDASLTHAFFLEGETSQPINVPGSPPSPDTRLLVVGPAFFTTMQIPMLAGRDIEERDRPGSPVVAVINEAFAKANFGDRNPLGRHLILSNEGRPAREMEIIGVSRNARYGALQREIPPVVYLTYNQGYPDPQQMVYALRTTGDPLRYVNSIREIVHQADSRLPVTDIKTQTAAIDQTINQEIMFARLCSGFAILALIIACVGLYGTVSYNVARRTGEIGIRMALGAQRGRVVRMVLREVILLASAGLVIGMVLAFSTSKLVESFLYGMKSNDPAALMLAVLILMSAALLAGYVPARRASRTDPMTALRHE